MAKEMIKKFRREILESYELTKDTLKKEELDLLDCALDDVNFIIRCMNEDFPLEYAPCVVFLFDLDTDMLWRGKGRGYTRELYSAGLYPLEDAKKIVEADDRRKTKIVYVSE